MSCVIRKYVVLRMKNKVAGQLHILSKKKRKLKHTLFSNISKNTYPMKINFMSS